MSTFFMFGNYSQEALKGISADRTNKAKDIITNNGGELKSAYALLGEHDLVLITDFQNTEDVMKASIAF